MLRFHQWSVGPLRYSMKFFDLAALPSLQARSTKSQWLGWARCGPFLQID